MFPDSQSRSAALFGSRARGAAGRRQHALHDHLRALCDICGSRQRLPRYRCRRERVHRLGQQLLHEYPRLRLPADRRGNQGAGVERMLCCILPTEAEIELSEITGNATIDQVRRQQRH